jgi:L,D-peptidoglycan transpeptidase YkuD (ErfK/YbiS/YcfS/YnhG family)
MTREGIFMRKAFQTAIVLILILAVPASAATTLSKYSLIVSGKRVALSSTSGYVGKSGSRLTIPLRTVCDALSIEYTVANSGKLMYMEGSDKSRVAVCSGYAYAKVNGKKQSLRSSAYVKNGLLMADLSVLKMLGADYKTATASTLAGKGYPDGAVSISLAGKSVTFPTLTTDESLAAQLPAASSCNQMVVVQYKSGSSATLTMHEKDSEGVWRQILSSYAYLGKKGIGKTKEGDMKTPVGTFNLKTPFGIKANPGTSLDYVKVTKYHYWCGSTGSKYYNQLIDTRVTNRARTSSDEYLINYKGVYNYGAFIDYNASGTAGKGSCIFLHCTGGSKSTAGCVAVPESVMIKILKALKSGCKIVIY